MCQKVYVFKDKIIFWPEKKLLTDESDGLKSVQLTGPASRCLALIVSRKDLVTQNELYNHGWEGSGFTPSPNTLYQSISVLRRAFRELDDSDENFILTETRKGFRFNPEISVLVEIREFFNEKSSENVVQIAQDSSFSDTASVASEKKKNRFKLISALFLTSICIVIIVIVLLGSTALSDHSSYFSGYKKYAYNERNCTFFLSNESQTSLVSMKSLSLLSCEARPYNYITTHSYSSNVSVISCDKEINAHPADCSTLYLRKKNEN